MTSRGMDNVSARLLIHPSGFDCLKDSKHSVLSNISKETGATMQILEQSYTHAGASIDEKVMQIDGEYSSVQIALFQVSWMLRESIFGKILANNKSPLLPHKLFNLPPYLNKTAVLTQKMKLCKVSEGTNGWAPPKARHIEFLSGDCLSTHTHPRDSTTVKGGPEHGSNSKFVIMTNTKIEIAVRAHFLSSIFGDDGSNLSRLRTSSCGFIVMEEDILAGKFCTKCCELQSQLTEKEKRLGELEVHVKLLEEKNLKLKHKNSNLEKNNLFLSSELSQAKFQVEMVSKKSTQLGVVVGLFSILVGIVLALTYKIVIM